MFAQSEHDKWEQNEITGNEIKITGNKKRLKIKIQNQNQNQNQIQNKKKKTKKTKSKKSQVPCFSMLGMDKKSEARKENLYTHIFFCVFHLICLVLCFLMLLLLPLRFHLPSIFASIWLYFIRSYAFPPCVISHLVSASPMPLLLKNTTR